MKTLATIFVVTMLSVSAATIATSQTMNHDGPPIEDIAADLGVTAAALESCAPDQQPARGERPSREEHDAAMQTLADCLQSSNSSITAAMIGGVMEKYRPAPPDQG